MNTNDTVKKSKLKFIVPVILILGAVMAYVAWDRGFRVHPQPDWVTEDEATRFMYGSIGAEFDAGIPYWIFYVLPRMFPEKLPGPGGYASLGVPWEEGYELPIGFTKKTIGFPRVANNCAVCHTTRYRTAVDSKPVFVPLGPGHTSNVQGFFKFLVDTAKDPRFNADNIMTQIQLNTKLDLIDQLLYRFFIIPMTKKALLEREHQFQWIYNQAYPDWGPGRDDAMNLTKYFMLEVDPPDDGTFGPTDFPSIWNLKKYDTEPDELHSEGLNQDGLNPNDLNAGKSYPKRMNLAGDSWNAYSVVIDSALGLLGAAPNDNDEFIGHVKWITDYAKRSSAPVYPFAIDQQRVARGKQVFDAQCGICHAEENNKVGRPMLLTEVGTSRDRIDTWGKEYAIKANQVASAMGLERRGLVEQDLIGYNVPYLDGIWLRAPYLHNGSVPTLRDLLKLQKDRPTTFYRGYDVFDAENVGFIVSGSHAEKEGVMFDVSRKGNSNMGHEFGTGLAEKDKNALIEYMKTLWQYNKIQRNNIVHVYK